MQFRSVLLVVVMAISIPSFVSGGSEANKSGRVSLAVIDPEVALRRDSAMAGPLADAIRREISRANEYKIMDAAVMQKIFQENNFVLLNCSVQECAVKAGKMLNVEKVVAGTLNRTGKTCYLTLFLINVANGRAEVVQEEKSSCGPEEVMQTGRIAVQKLLGIAGPESPAMPVAGPAVNSRFGFTDTYATDGETGLIWAKNADPAKKQMTWESAGEYVQQLNKEKFAEQDDWRLPSKEEFAALVEYAKNRGANRKLDEFYKKTGFRNVRADYYWTSTNDVDIRGLVWMVDMYGGELASSSMTGLAGVWPVRTVRATWKGSQ